MEVKRGSDGFQVTFEVFDKKMNDIAMFRLFLYSWMSGHQSRKLNKLIIINKP